MHHQCLTLTQKTLEGWQICNCCRNATTHGIEKSVDLFIWCNRTRASNRKTQLCKSGKGVVFQSIYPRLGKSNFLGLLHKRGLWIQDWRQGHGVSTSLNSAQKERLHIETSRASAQLHWVSQMNSCNTECHTPHCLEIHQSAHVTCPNSNARVGPLSLGMHRCVQPHALPAAISWTSHKIPP